MAIQYINIAVGAKMANGDVIVSSKGKGSAQSGHVSIAYDDAVVTQNSLLAALRQAMLIAQSDSSIAKG